MFYVDDVCYFFSLFIRVVSMFFFVWRVYEIEYFFVIVFLGGVFCGGYIVFFVNYKIENVSIGYFWVLENIWVIVIVFMYV